MATTIGTSSTGGSAPSPSSTQSSTSSSTSSSSPEPSSGSTSTLERAESVQVPESASGSGSPSDTLSTTSVESDPPNSVQLTSAQEEASEEVTGQPVSQGEEARETAEDESETASTSDSQTVESSEADPSSSAPPELTPDEEVRMEEYRDLQARLGEIDDIIDQNDATIEAAGGMGTHEAVAPGALMMERLQVIEEIQGMHDDYSDVLQGVEIAYEDVQQQRGFNEALLTTNGALMQGEELEALQNFAADELAEASQPFEAATDQLLAHIEDPVFQEFFKDWDPGQQQDFVRDVSQYLPQTEAGRAWIAELNDGFVELDQSGQAGTFPEAFAELRGQLSESELQALDHDLGGLVGIDLIARPEGAEDRLAAVASALNLPDEQTELMLHAGPEDDPAALGAFAQSVGLTLETHEQVKEIFGTGDLLAQASETVGMVGATSGGLKGLAELASRSLRSGKALRALRAGLDVVAAAGKGVADTAGVVGDVFDVITITHQVSRGELFEAGTTAVGMVGGAMLASSSAPVAITGGALVGVSMVAPAVLEHHEYMNFKEEAMRAVLGDSPRSTMRSWSLTDASVNGIQRLDSMRPEGMTLPDFFEQRLNTMPEGRALTFWELIDEEYKRQNNLF